MKYFLLCFLSIASLVSYQSCNCDHNKNNNSQLDLNPQNSIWADTITYEVMISNPDSTNSWETQKLKNVSQRKIVDDIFELVYNNDKKAFNYYTHDPMSIQEIETLEKEENFSRDKVGKLQFTEIWKMNKATQKLHKEVLSILIAYEIYNSEGELRGYKAAFYINL